ncbi:hypothetical protein E1262_14180 [Jiangella aurantiaca]|uniref:Uncharacterized protein n=1 Tax=Jiangella aurantiaca TaxID=2530373 RepID=A0A4R5A9H5_9ACTN|nr:hypothetical protein [Jiangella aurantiaca]TDD68893.1 hypothetical protein E1262_14180 [Jiangella aurantiaca]
MWSNGPTAGTASERARTGHRLAWGALLSLAGSAAVVASAWGSGSRIGAPSYWPWLLTGIQVLALWSAGSERWWGWLLGAAVQPPWIAYALVTGQFGFIPGCTISAAVQANSFARWNGLAPGTTGAPPHIKPTKDPAMRG